jgi:outer membrane protein assembly factor BamB
MHKASPDSEMTEMRTRHRLFPVALAAGLCASGLFLLAMAAAQQPAAQVQPVPVQKGGKLKRLPGAPAIGSSAQPPGSQYSAIKLVEKTDYRRLIEAARHCIEDKQWNDTVTALQTILDDKEDYYVLVKERDRRTGQEEARWTSVKFEANNLLGSMPSEGLDVYEVRYGGKARKDLEEARQKGDREELALVAQRYLHTRAGAEANDLLAATFLDRGQFFMAALRYERLLGLRPDRVKLDNLSLFKAALAFRRAGDLKNAQATWDRFEARVQRTGGLRLEEEIVPVAKLRAVLDAIPRPEVSSPHDWPRVGGNLANTAQASGSQPILDLQLWQRPTILDKSDETGDKDRGEAASSRLTDALTKHNSDTPSMPGFFPIAAADRLFYRTYVGVSAVWLKDQKDAQGNVAARAGTIDWKSTDLDGSLGVILDDPAIKDTFQQWLGTYAQSPGFAGLVYENSAVGTVATDHRLIYAVDDLAIPAPPQFSRAYNPSMGSEKVRALQDQSILYAFEIEGGKLKWRLPSEEQGQKASEYANTHFLGTPLSVGGKLYVINEAQNGDLRLLCIDPMKYADPTTKREPVVLSVQTLGNVQDQYRIANDVVRRTHTVHLGYGEGILVCPTNAGEILGIDLLSRGLAWAYPYREQSPNVQTAMQPGMPPGVIMRGPGGIGMVQAMPLQMTAAHWKVTPPYLVDGKVVFTAPDAQSIHCISLRDGRPIWKVPQQEHDLFLAGVFQGKVLVIGKHSCRALRLADGKTEWVQGIDDLPSGQGVASRDVYYLPLRKGEICAIDMGKIVGRMSLNRTGKSGGPAPGNLVFYEGSVLSQTPREIVAYAQLSAKMAEVDAAVAKSPNDPRPLSDRGELRLADGQVKAAVDDLHAALKNHPQANLERRIRAKLYEALTDLLQIDFNQASAQYLDEYRELCKVADNPQEQQAREAKFLRLLGQGREQQGDLVEAFLAYRAFGDLPVNKEEGIAASDDPTHKIPTNVWLRGRIAAMMATARPEQRKPLEDKIAEEWRAVLLKNDIEAIRSFVGMFDVPFKVGREARLQLAEAILTRNDRSAFLEAELSLEQLRGAGVDSDARLAARALEDLARLEVKKGNPESMKLAASYYRQLGERFGAVPVRDGKTGADLFNELTTDKRFLPYLGEAGPLWPNARIEARELPRGHFGPAVTPALPAFVFQNKGDLTPFVRNLRVELEYRSYNPQLRLVDATSGKVRWSVTLGSLPIFDKFQYLYQSGHLSSNVRADAPFRFCQVKGHLGVVQVGTLALGLDLDNPRILWKHDLLETNIQANGFAAQPVMVDADGCLVMTSFNQFNRQPYQLRIGYIGAAEASYVCLRKEKSLAVLDPLHGTILWSRPLSAEMRVHAFGDDRHIYLVTSRDGSSSATGQVLRANDGVAVTAPDFGALFSRRVRILGNELLIAQPGNGGLTVRLYDILTGKDRWQRVFDPKAVVVQTEDPYLTGAVEPNGKLTVVDLRTLRDVLHTSVLHGRIGADDVKNLYEPLLLHAGEVYYLALNQPVDHRKVMNGVLQPNISSGVRCRAVNGWFCAFDKKGEFLWHSYAPLTNQLVVLDRFEVLPVLLFSASYVQTVNGVAANRWVHVTQSIHKKTGKMIYDPVERPNIPMMAQFYALTIDTQERTINLIGANGSVQHYVDDGTKRTTGRQAGAESASRGGNGGPDAVHEWEAGQIHELIDVNLDLGNRQRLFEAQLRQRSK